MILFELTGTENHPVYQALEVENGERQHQFLTSVVRAALDMNKVFLSQAIIKSLNFHAITCLHTNAGEYRPCEVEVGSHRPPQYFRVQALMDDFVNEVNRVWDRMDPVVLASFVLWRLNWIHPFINGNGRTARATAYFVLCLKSGGLIRGAPILPELLKRDRDDYVAALQAVDAALPVGLHLGPVHSLVAKLLDEQIRSAPVDDELPVLIDMEPAEA